MPKIIQKRPQKWSPNRQKSMSESLVKCKLKTSTQIFEILSQNGPNMGPKWVPNGSQNPPKIDPRAPWQPLGPQDGPKLAPGSSKKAQKDPK